MSNFKYFTARRRRPWGEKAEEEEEERKRNNTKTGKEKRKRGERKRKRKRPVAARESARERAKQQDEDRLLLKFSAKQVSRRNEANERVSVGVGETTTTCSLLSSLGYHLTLDPRREEKFF